MPNLTRTSSLLKEIKQESVYPMGEFVRADRLFGLFDCLIKDLNTEQPSTRLALKGLMEIMKNEGWIENYSFESLPLVSTLKINPGNGKRQLYFAFKDNNQ